ncbi:hypothetical protein ACTXT7_001367 [Hymenolepis weldensis]
MNNARYETKLFDNSRRLQPERRDEPRAGSSKKLNSEQFQVAIDENPTCTTREVSEIFHNYLMGQRLASREEVEVKLVSFFDSKVAKFYEEGMRKLMARWEDVMNKNGDYVEY